MSATLARMAAPMSVSAARQLLRDTSGVAPERAAEAEKTVAAFYAARPVNRPCVACGGMVWTEHSTADGNPSWACAGCHRSSALTSDEWQAQQAAAEAVRSGLEAKERAAAPDPRAALQSALERRTEAAGALSRLEAALPAARAALAAALARHDAATAAMSTVAQVAAERAVANLTGDPGPLTGATNAARGNLSQAADAVAAARGARALIDDRLTEARRALANAEAAVRAAALRLIAAEELEPLIEAAADARSDYLEAIGGLAWLIRNGAVPSGDVRPHQLARDADTAPSAWPEAASAGGGMTQRLAELVAGETP